MLPMVYLGWTHEELAAIVAGEVWSEWLSAEPDLGAVGSLAELDALHGLEADRPLGALLRLAAQDGGDDRLAAIAVTHQMEGAVAGLIRRFAGLSDCLDAVVVSALWEEIRTFPWRRRSRAYAANLMLDTRGAVGAMLLPERRRPGRAVLTDPRSWDDFGVLPPVQQQVEPEVGAEDELTDLLAWAVSSGVVSASDSHLLFELVEAGAATADSAPYRSSRGVSNSAAVDIVARRCGVSARTVIRQRDAVIGRLRRNSHRYFAAVA